VGGALVASGRSGIRSRRGLPGRRPGFGRGPHGCVPGWNFRSWAALAPGPGPVAAGQLAVISRSGGMDGRLPLVTPRPGEPRA